MKTSKDNVRDSRDFILLSISCVAIIISFYLRSKDVFFEEVWKVNLEGTSSYYSNEHFPKISEKLPKPLITDLDGDGKNEIVLVTTDYKIKIYELSSSTGQLILKKEASLKGMAKLVTGRKPVALSSGYITPFSTSNTRIQVITVVLNGWTILCFNNELELLWESNVNEYIPSSLYFSEASLIIIPTSLRVGDKGSVIVGARLAVEERERTGHEHDPSIKQQESDKEDEHEHQEIEEDVEEEIETIEKLTKHFSYYAFDGRTGSLRWKHDFGDFFDKTHKHKGMNEDDNDDDHGLLPEHSYKLHVISNANINKHIGEVDWREFRENILHHLPHMWRSREDTEFVLDHFSRNPTSGRNVANKPSTWSSEDIGLPSSHIHIDSYEENSSGYSRVPHSASDHVIKPNVIVSHTKDGIEAIHLYTGRTVCKLSMQSKASQGEGILYTDINGDGIVEKVQTVVGFNQQNPSRSRLSIVKSMMESRGACYGYAMSGMPASEMLFNVSLCSRGTFLDFNSENENLKGINRVFADLTYGTGVLDLDATFRKSLEATNPITIPSGKTSSDSYFKEESYSHSEQRDFDTIFLVSTGKLSSFGSNGRIRWQIDEPSLAWVRHKVASGGSKRGKPEDEGIFPSLEVFVPQVSRITSSKEKNKLANKEIFILAVTSSISLISPDGGLVSSTPLLETQLPVTSPVIGDFNNDGLNDIVIVSSKGYHGFTLSHSLSILGLLPFLASALLVIVSAIIKSKGATVSFSQQKLKL